MNKSLKKITSFIFFLSIISIDTFASGKIDIAKTKNGCDNNKVADCILLGKLSSNSTKNIELNQAQSYFEKSCELRSGDGCSYLSKLLSKRDPLNFEGIFFADSYGCLYGNFNSCESAKISWKLLANAAEQELSSDILKCSKSNPESCLIVGQTYLEGTQVIPANKQKAKLYFSNGCKLNNAISCHLLGDLLYQVPSKIAISQMQSSYKKACSLNMYSACHNLAIIDIELFERGFEVDLNESKNLFEYACKGGFKASCDELKAIHKNKKK